MKKLLDWLKNSWGILLGLVLYLIAVKIIYNQILDIRFQMQAWGVVTLVFITIYYAWQTQRLVKQQQISLEEDKKKREADFWLVRLKEYYSPLKYNLNYLTASLDSETFFRDEFMVATEKILKIVGHNQYLITEDLLKKEENLLYLLAKNKDHFLHGEIPPEIVSPIIQAIKKIFNTIEEEIRFIEEKLVKTYGFFTVESTGMLKLQGKKGPIQVMEKE